MSGPVGAEPDKLPDGQEPAKRSMPGAVLFICGMNSIRSPIAETLARSLLPPDRKSVV